MKSYVVPGINAAQREQLKDAGIPFSNWANGILITGPTTLAEALRVLNATAREVETQYENFFEVVLTYHGNGGNVADEDDRYFGETFNRGEPHEDNGEIDHDDPADETVDETITPNDNGFDLDGDPRDINWVNWRNRRKVGEDGKPGKRRPKVLANPAAEAEPTKEQSKSRLNYIKACANRFDEVRDNARLTSIPMLERVQVAGAQFVVAARNSAFAGSQASDDELRKRFEDELAQIRALDKVHDVRVIPGGVLVYTHELFATQDTGIRRKIGRFMIWIRTTGKEAGVYWYNSSRRVDAARDAMNAPYVYADGKPSCDEITASMLEMIGRCELSMLVDVAIQYVETIDPLNPLSAYVENWPKEKKKGAEDLV